MKVVRWWLPNEVMSGECGWRRGVGRRKKLNGEGVAAYESHSTLGLYIRPNVSWSPSFARQKTQISTGVEVVIFVDRMAAYQQKIAKSYNNNIRIRRFQVGDLVLRKAFQNTTNPMDGKLAPKWEGPYKIDSEDGKGAYRLITTDGEPLPRAWNAIHLKTYFI
ncbi:hypothetical protein E3N88_28739 [Mikania micrantha]|uniref:Reverse transcriptase domain-containing protein n=1 Tax=Mikania micrantha TaxID=192012 RepID=A0A5N6N0M6_9ASTR|nr:hypothetical protein E3N88_28739 [Mikania micrantha]